MYIEQEIEYNKIQEAMPLQLRNTLIRLHLYGNIRRKNMIYRALIFTLQNVGLVYAEGLS